MGAAETVREILKAYVAGELDAVMALCADDISMTWVSDPRFSAQSGEARGAEAFRERLCLLHKTFVYDAFMPLDMFSRGNRVAVQIEVLVTHRGTGRQFSMRSAEFWTVKGGVATEMVEYFDTALVAAMSEPQASA